MKILYVEPKHNNPMYHYYNNIGIGLQQTECSLKIVNTIDNNNLDDYNLVILGYGACCNSNYTSKNYSLDTKTPVIAFLFKLSLDKDKKFEFFKRNNIIVFGQSHRIKEFEKQYKIEIKPTIYPFDPTLFHDYKLEKIYDVGFTGAIHSIENYGKEAYLEGEKNIRERLLNLIKKHNYKTYIKCSDKSFSESKIINNLEYAQTINKSKIWIATNADHGDLTPRYCEVVACRTLLFCNEHLYNTFNNIFKHEETCVFFKNDLNDLIEKINYYLNNEEEYKRIVNNAYELFHNNYTCKKIAEKYLLYAQK